MTVAVLGAAEAGGERLVAFGLEPVVERVAVGHLVRGNEDCVVRGVGDGNE
jgi:hypothetical protein